MTNFRRCPVYGTFLNIVYVQCQYVLPLFICQVAEAGQFTLKLQLLSFISISLTLSLSFKFPNYLPLVRLSLDNSLNMAVVLFGFCKSIIFLSQLSSVIFRHSIWTCIIAFPFVFQLDCDMLFISVHVPSLLAIDKDIPFSFCEVDLVKLFSQSRYYRIRVVWVVNESCPLQLKHILYAVSLHKFMSFTSTFWVSLCKISSATLYCSLLPLAVWPTSPPPHTNRFTNSFYLSRCKLLVLSSTHVILVCSLFTVRPRFANSSFYVSNALCSSPLCLAIITRPPTCTAFISTSSSPRWTAVACSYGSTLSQAVVSRELIWHLWSKHYHSVRVLVHPLYTTDDALFKSVLLYRVFSI